MKTEETVGKGGQIAVIDGSLVDIDFIEGGILEETFTVSTPAGDSPPIHLCRWQEVPFYYVHFHGVDWRHALLDACPKVFYALHELGVTDIGLDTNAPFEDYLRGTSGEGCLILVSGTGADFANHSDVFMQLRNMLVNIGWTPDPQYDADGPTGTLGGFRRDASLMLVTVGWEPSSDANCPQDQPISACPLTPEQQIYTIMLSVAMQ